MVHTLRLDNYSPTPRKLVLGTNSSFGTESIKIERGAGWDGLNLTATWHIPGREEPLRVALLDGDAMDVPPEVTKEAKDGVLVLAGLASGVQRASCNVEYLILEQAGVYGGADAEPTPELAAQVLEAALQAKADAEAAAEDAAAAKANADKAQADAEKAQQAAENAAADAAKAGPYAEAAWAAQEAAELARDEAITAQQAAENAAAAAAASKSAADTLAAEAARAAQAAAKSEANAKQSADTLAESVENVVANTAAVAELKQQVENITPDNSSIGDKPWSSKHIIDMLCPPLEESGNPVVCYPVAGYPLGVKAKWKPMQEGSGTPSPENIRPIKGRDSVKVERCGENLLDVAQCRAATPSAAYGLTVTVDDTGLIRVLGIPKVNNDTPTATFRILFANQVILTKEYKAKWFVVKGVVNAITRIQNDKSIVLQSPLSPNTSVDVQFRLMYYTGDEPTTYTPFIGQTNTLTLPETVYGGEVDAVSGGGKETRKLVTLDGTTNKFTKAGMFWNLPGNSTPGILDNFDINSSHFPTRTFGGNTRLGFLFTRELDMSKYFPDVNALNAYLVAQYAAGTPVQACYWLEEPVPFTATGAQPIPALAGANTVLTDADNVTVTGRADPIKRITDLEDAVASQT